jgi:hypothetical protein
MLYRHGDVLIQKTTEVPAEAKELKGLILAEGEVTGHSHRIKETANATLHRLKEIRYLTVTAVPATVTHEEHGPIELPLGIYKVWRQREYTPERIITVRD